MSDFYFWSVVIFFLGLATLIYKDRKNIEFHKIILIKRSKRGRDIIDKAAGVSPRLWSMVAVLFVLASLMFMAYGTYLIFLSTRLVMDGTFKQPAIQIILPIPQPQPISGSGFIGVPFWFWILVVPFVMFPHEFLHGVMARVNNIRINNVGLIQLLIFSGAFVEPNENDLRRASLINKLKVFSAGSMANITIAVILILMSRMFLWPLIIPSGILITEVVDGSGAEFAGLKSGMVIQEIDGNPVTVDYDLFTASYAYLLLNNFEVTKENIDALSTTVSLSDIIQNYSPNQTVELVADGKAFSLTFSGRPENSTIPYMGVLAEGVRGSEFTIDFLFPLIWWLSTLSYFVAMFNLLPINPLDGGLMLEAVSEKYIPKKHTVVTKTISSFMILLLIINFFGPTVISALG